MSSKPQIYQPTHEVWNQPPLHHPDLWADVALQEGLAQKDAREVKKFARALSTDQMHQAAREANRYPPELVSFDRGGRRLDEVSFHPSYHALLRLGLLHGYAATAWDGGTHVAHAAMVYLMSQVEPGVCCPMTMSYAAVAALDGSDLADAWVPKLMSRSYDPSVAPLADKSAVTLGMAMTEKQGGSDVRANTTRAIPEGDNYRLIGHKWFCSAPMSDGFLTLAQAPGGLTCFLVPRWLPDGRNAIHVMRLKEKLGNRANASAEIEYHGALAFRLGDEGDGVRQIIEMVHHTRLDTAMAPAGLMRAALREAVHWSRHRSVFQKRLIDQPLMRAVLADLALEVEGALALGLRVARAFDDKEQRGFARIAVALAKFLNNKRAPLVIYECMEALGGMGYTDDTPLPMLYREAPLNSIWEGSGNVICLDILRSLAKDPVARDQLMSALDAARPLNRSYALSLDAFQAHWVNTPPESDARYFAESAARLLTASVLLSDANPLSDNYVASRLDAARGHIYGAVKGLDAEAILSRQ